MIELPQVLNASINLKKEGIRILRKQHIMIIYDDIDIVGTTEILL